jgi:putative transposase
MEGIVILTDHVLCIWTLPAGDADFLTRWHDIKTRFAAQIPKGEKLSTRRLKKGMRGIWQRRFWEHVIRDERDYERHMDYIHYNPVKPGYVTGVGDWPYSSFPRQVRHGIYNLDWAARALIKKTLKIGVGRKIQNIL